MTCICGPDASSGRSIVVRGRTAARAPPDRRREPDPPPGMSVTERARADAARARSPLGANATTDTKPRSSAVETTTDNKTHGRLISQAPTYHPEPGEFR